MQRAIVGAGLVILTCCAALAQSTVNLPSFEVASIKPAGPVTDGRIRVMMRGGPGTPDPGQITYTNVTLKNLMMNAYNVKGYQISGPDWFESQRYDITAKLPPNTSKEQFALMLQNLLAERFKLTLHHQSKELPMYALVVAKGGPKMKESVVDPNAAPAGGPNAGGPDGGRGGPLANAAGGGGGRVTMGKDGFPQFPPGGRGGMLMMMGGNGRMRLAANGQSTGQLAEMLSNQLSRPVLDMTGLKANYDYTLEFASDEASMGLMKGMPMPMPKPGDSDGGGPAAAPDGSSGPTIFSAVQEQLGLKLEARKGPVDMLIVDTLEKVPTEN